MGKPKGIGAGRKLATVRRENRWSDKSYRKSHSGARWKVRNCS